MASYVDKGFRNQQGVFTVFFSWRRLPWASPPCSLLRDWGFRSGGARSALCKAVGWKTTDVMLMVTFEQVLLSVLAACLAFLVSYLVGAGLQRRGGGPVLHQRIGQPGGVSRARTFGFAPWAMSLLLCLTITLCGGLFTTWRLAARLPADCIR